MKKLAVILLLFLSTVNAQGVDNQSKLNSQETFKILGIELGKDTIDDLEKIIERKNCRILKKSESYHLSKECFDLPGDYTIGYFFDPSTRKISSIDFTLDLTAVDSRAARENYFDALRSKYGNPISEQNFSSLSTWKWDFPNLNIDVSRNNQVFSIRYTSRVVTKMVKEREVNKISSQM